MTQVDHYPTCRSNYPEKLEGEVPKQLKTLDIGGGKIVVACADCGAYKVIRGDGMSKLTELFDELKKALKEIDERGTPTTDEEIELLLKIQHRVEEIERMHEDKFPKFPREVH